MVVGVVVGTVVVAWLVVGLPPLRRVVVVTRWVVWVVRATVVGGTVEGAAPGVLVVGARVVEGGAEVVEKIVVAPSVGIAGTPAPAPGAVVESVGLARQGPSPQAEGLPVLLVAWSPNTRAMATAATPVATQGWRPA